MRRSRPRRRSSSGSAPPRRERAPDLRLRARCAPADLDRAHREHRRLARGEVAADREREQREPDDDRAAGRRERARSNERAAARGQHRGAGGRPLGGLPQRDSSPRRARPLQRRQLERPEELHLVLELDTELLAHAPARLGHHRDAVGGRRTARVLDEVRVARRDRARRRSGGPSARTPRSCARRPARSSGFLNTLPKVRLFVGCVALRCASSSAALRLDRLRRARLEPERAPARRPGPAPAPSGDTTARAPRRRPSAAPAASTTTASISTSRHSTPVGAGVHAHTAAGGARDRGGELEAAEPGRPRAMEADGIRRAAADHERLALDASRSELARELEHERVDPVVVHEQVRAEPDHLDRRSLLARPARAPPAARRPSPAARTSAPGRRCRSSCSARASMLLLHEASEQEPTPRSMSPAPRRAARRQAVLDGASRVAPCLDRRRPRRRARHDR